ncbi:hypothetical protein ASPZODRAFT_52789, partial [Penicilliopsis zonata CBS 506.65]
SPSPVMPKTDPDCTKYHRVVQGDTCDGIDRQHGITLAEITHWNPLVGPDCTNLWLGYYVCVDAPDKPIPSTETVLSPLEPSTEPKCTKWHLVESGDTCFGIEHDYGITDAQFHNWNPLVGTDCAGLWLGYYVCV